MTTTDTADVVRRPPSEVGRILNVAKLMFVNPATIVTVPLTILALIFLVNWLIWWVIYSSVPVADRIDAAEGTQYSGASLFIFVYLLIVAVQAMNLTFPYALGFGVTRRDFYLGSAATFVVLSAGWSTLLAILAWVESATGGWGLGGRMFTAVYFGDGPLPERWWLTFVLFLFFFFTGAAFGSVYVRWKQYGLITLFAILAFALVGALALIVATDSWGRIGEFFADAGFVGGYSLALIPTAISAIAGFFLLRGATPRN